MMLVIGPMLILGSTMHTDGSIVEEVVKGILMGMGLVFTLVYLYDFGKRRKKMG